MVNSLECLGVCTCVLGQDPGKLKVPRSSVAASPEDDQSGDEVEVKPLEDTTTVGIDSEFPSGRALSEIDDMDAAEAAQFKADVQGHRHTEVRVVLHRRNGLCRRVEEIFNHQLYFSAHACSIVCGTAMLFSFAIVF